MIIWHVVLLTALRDKKVWSNYLTAVLAPGRQQDPQQVNAAVISDVALILGNFT